MLEPMHSYTDHCPLYRQSSILKRDTGIEISRGTMCGWIPSSVWRSCLRLLFCLPLCSRKAARPQPCL
jgi:Transposase IS66 family